MGKEETNKDNAKDETGAKSSKVTVASKVEKEVDDQPVSSDQKSTKAEKAKTDSAHQVKAKEQAIILAPLKQRPAEQKPEEQTSTETKETKVKEAETKETEGAKSADIKKDDEPVSETKNTQPANPQKASATTAKASKNSTVATAAKITVASKTPKTAKTANATNTAKSPKANKQPNKAKNQKGEEATNSTNTDLKLPLFRRIHIKISYVVTGIVVVLLSIFFGRVAIWEHDYLNRMEGSERHTTSTSGNAAVGDDGEAVDTTEPTETQIREYIVAPDKPRYFSIPSLGIYNARIVELGVKENGELATPGNIYDMGWYTGSSLPGERGVSMIDGHGGDAGYGILRTLPRIAIGAIIKIEMGDGRVFNYRVVDTATKAIGDEANEYMATAFTTPDGVLSSLSMITCTGDYWQYSQTYSHRFFLRAALEE